MALELALSLDSGIELPNAYARVSGINHGHNELTVHVQFWSSAASRADLKPTIKEHSFSLPWQETVSLAAVYNLLKSEALFVNATDV